ncbi:hypothetical protein B0T26DRAFT_680249 [Lasiosphaeria miniovina]|uniref:PSP proline-rich domain-containing protein n=1 Tax=Lasiosphaeria miniovina TaxID=1954250 RepID=A0AA40A030_9PEZI|nr:uncharacterized protein B0T26DRAFT_680249 [Lasiosphaeria miniovina]KAK0706584.1 hypothetical protein B0T26DRAFT_680249 [Lasiosphaeria miniovina]
MAQSKDTKNKLRRLKKREQKKAKAAETAAVTAVNDSRASVEPKDEQAVSPSHDADNLAVKAPSSVQESTAEAKSQSGVSATVSANGAAVDDDIDLDIDEGDLLSDPAYADYKNIFEKFGTGIGDDEVAREANAGNKGEVFFDDNEGIPSEGEDDARNRLSKKKRKQLNKLTIAELKASVKNPEVVEWNDVSSSDPRLLVHIKSQRNVVPVPPHWALKREYLSSKRGVEKPPFKLPKFIADTGITEMRDAVLEKQAEQTLKQKQRERMQPKMGKLDIDYQKLYDAFFRHQTKPELTRFGDVYHEGKEWEADYKIFKPGEISEGLREALGMQPDFPPPWLLQQQRVGPPPSYPTLKIPGLNAPLPPGASFGFQPGQWGKPPLDEFNRPVYGGDIFGIMGAPQPGAPYQQQPLLQQPVAVAAAVEPIDRTLWGELQPLAEESEEEESDEEESDDEGADVPGGTETFTGLETPGGYASTIHPDSVPSGVETNIGGEFDLRKTRRGFETEEAPRSAYQVIPERQVRAEGFFGSDKTYELPKHGPGHGPPVLGQEDDSTRKRKKPGDVDVALDPDALVSQNGIDKEELRRQYETTSRQDGLGAQWAYREDLSEMIAKESRKRQKLDEKANERKRDDKKKEKYTF